MKINLTHGNGGLESSKLINEIFMKHFKNEFGSAEEDAAILNISGKTAFTTDSFVIKPIFFNGGDIGRLAVCGTVNDLLTSGAVPRYLSAGFIIEEGFDIDLLDKIVCSMKEAAAEAQVMIVTGDTKIIEGNGGICINTSGIGELTGSHISFRNTVDGDKIILTGTLGEHHSCITSSRMGIKNNIKSDVSPLNKIVKNLRESKVTLHGIRDVTRGGLATCLNEITKLCGLRVYVHESSLPVGLEVMGLCGILGLDPLYMTNEGKMLISVPENEANKALDVIRASQYGENAAIIGECKQHENKLADNSLVNINDDTTGVILITKFGGKRILPPLSGESLPRIC